MHADNMILRRAGLALGLVALAATGACGAGDGETAGARTDAGPTAETAAAVEAEAANPEVLSAVPASVPAVRIDAGKVVNVTLPEAQEAVASVKAGAVGVAEDVVAEYAALTGDAVNGKKLFVMKQCASCHALQPGQNRAGPSLHAIVGRPAGTVEGYGYSAANKKSGLVWEEAVLFKYLENPRKFMPGTKMAFAGLPGAQDRADLIAYLKAPS